MFSSEDLDKIKEKIYQFKIGTAKNNNGDEKEKPRDNKNNTKCGLNLNPSEILVIAGLLSGALEVSGFCSNFSELFSLGLNKIDLNF